MTSDHPDSDPASAVSLEGIAPEQLPRHVAIIMDGNGRWAQQRGLPRIEGHRQGAETVERIVTESRKLGLEALTLYSFSTENWKRPEAEIRFLMDLCVEHLQSQRSRLVEHGIRFRHVGRTRELPEVVVEEIRKSTEATKACTGLTLCLALNYGSRDELLDATAAIARKAQDGNLDPDSIDEDLFADHLYTRGLPDPDLLLRTAGEMRISNFLLWQISYAELVVTDTLWPDLQVEDFHAILRRYSDRERRFGGLKPE
ncbi:MAG: isoprenyl transferase [Phycisphaerales bacterium]|nr:isoprenyl transferase [Phycisphaerales bacterium]